MDYRRLTQKLVAIFGALNNTILAILIIFKSPKNLGNYKYLMLYIALFEVAYSVLDFLSMAEFLNKDSYCLIIIDKRETYLPECSLIYANLAFCSLFGVSLVIFSAHFVYRYLVISGSKLLKQHHTEKVIGLIVSTFIIGIAWSIMVLVLLGPNEYSDAVLRADYLVVRNITLEDINYVGAHFHMMSEDGTMFLNWKSFFALALMVVIIISSFSTVFYFGHKIYTRMTTMMMKSSSTKNLQSQLFWALVVQTVIPVVLMHLPISIGFMLTIFNKSVQLMGEIPTITLFLYPALDPLPNFFIIHSFRNALFEFICCTKLKGIRSKTVSAVPSEAVSKTMKTIQAVNVVTLH